MGMKINQKKIKIKIEKAKLLVKKIILITIKQEIKLII